MTLPSQTDNDHVDANAQQCSDSDLSQDTPGNKKDIPTPSNYDAMETLKLHTPGLKRERGFLPIEFVAMNLPYRRVDETEWIRANGNNQMTITARRFNTTAGESDRFIPYGKHARAILLYVMTQVKVSGSRDIELGSSFRSFMKQVGIPYSGHTAKNAMDQLIALLHCTFDFSVVDKSKPGFIGIGNVSYPVSDDYALWFDLRNEGLAEDGLLESRVRINESMYKSIMSSHTHPIDLKKYAAVASGKSPMALDILVWLSAKVYNQIDKKKAPEHISWEQLHEQFGSRSPLHHFKRLFTKELDKVLKVEMNAWVYVSEPGKPGVTQRKGFKGLLVGHKAIDTLPKPGVMGYAPEGKGTPPKGIAGGHSQEPAAGPSWAEGVAPF